MEAASAILGFNYSVIVDPSGRFGACSFADPANTTTSCTGPPFCPSAVTSALFQEPGRPGIVGLLERGEADITGRTFGTYAPQYLPPLNNGTVRAEGVWAEERRGGSERLS